MNLGIAKKKVGISETIPLGFLRQERQLEEGVCFLISCKTLKCLQEDLPGQPLSGRLVAEPQVCVQSFRNVTFVDGLIPLCSLYSFRWLADGTFSKSSLKAAPVAS